MGMKFVIPPTTTEVTFSVTVQAPLADRDAPDKENDVPSGVALTVPPGQVVEALGVAAIRIPFAEAPDVPSVVK